MDQPQNGRVHVLIWPDTAHARLGSRRGAGLLTLSIYSYVTLGKSLTGSKAPFPCLQGGAENGPRSRIQNPWVLQKSKLFGF